MNEIEIKDMDIEDVEDEIVERLEVCVTSLLSCELENRNCKRCKDRNNCLIFIRSVVAALCRIQIAQMSVPKKKIEEGMFI